MFLVKTAGGGLSFGTQKISGGNTPESKVETNLKTEIVSSDISPEQITEKIMKDTDCLPGEGKNGICTPEEGQKKLKEWLKFTNEMSPEQLIKCAKEKTGAVHESELFDTPALAHLDKDDYFLPEGPWNNDTWLNNINIDELLNKWLDFLGGYNFGVHMNNFDEKNKKLAVADYKQLCGKYNFLASVVNTDNYGQSGQHWVAIYIDCKLKTIEYFDSAAGTVSDEIMGWMTKMSKQLKDQNIGTYKTIYNNNVRHQKKNTECGVYSIFYIIARSHGVPHEWFENVVIDDDIMLNMRKRIFRNV